jgi:hypothetical protein
VKETTIVHLSHGTASTGGFLHEQRLLKALSEYLANLPCANRIETRRENQSFSGLGHFKLLWWSFLHAQFDINIVVVRCGLSAIMRNWFSKRKVIVVMHNYDEKDQKGFALRVYYTLLFFVLKHSSNHQIAICAVAPFWVNYFEKKVNHQIPVFLFPNLFRVEDYVKYGIEKKEKQIHLGQFSSKNDPAIFDLATKLSQKGYTCFFTTLFKEEQIKTEGYEVRFMPYEQYLIDMAKSEFTLAYIKLNEGWNRIAHESILVGTPVIGVNRGGLGDLLEQSNSLIATSEEHFLNLIITNETTTIRSSFLSEYDVSNQQKWITPLGLFSQA